MLERLMSRVLSMRKRVRTGRERPDAAVATLAAIRDHLPPDCPAHRYVDLAADSFRREAQDPSRDRDDAHAKERRAWKERNAARVVDR